MMNAVDRRPGRPLAWVLGGRAAPTCHRLDDNLKHGTAWRVSPDPGDACAQVLPQEHHRIGNAHPHPIERDTAKPSHHLARMTRRPTVVSNSLAMIHASLTRGCALNVPAIFEAYQALCLSIFN
jgi:IS1 family transposase